jgi:hypothetical protein
MAEVFAQSELEYGPRGQLQRNERSKLIQSQRLVTWESEPFALALITVIPVACPPNWIDVFARWPVGELSRSGSTLMRIASRLQRIPGTALAGG